MKIIVIGCGKIGISVISSLVSEGHDVVAVDINNDTLTTVGNLYDVMCVCGSATDCDVLREAGCATADIVVSITESDELNMLSCFLASKLGADHTIARIRNPEYSEDSIAFMKQNLELSEIINPELTTAHDAYNALKLQAAVKLESFSHRNLELVQLVITNDIKLDGYSLIDVKKIYKGNYLICSVSRGDDVIIPSGSFVLHNGDQIGLVAAPAEMPKVLGLLGFGRKKSKNIMIFGATRTACYLAKLLIEDGNSVKIIDRDLSSCNRISAEVPQAVVIHGTGSDHNLFAEEGLSDADAFVALTGIDEENILMSLYAYSQNVSKVITKVNSSELTQMAYNLGIPSVMSPLKVVSDTITKYARNIENVKGSNIENLYTLMNSSIKAIEFNVNSDFKGMNIPLKDLKLKKDILIAGIIRGKKAIIPTGIDAILPGDHVVIVAHEKQYLDLSDILA